jgi:hypothetical protein
MIEYQSEFTEHPNIEETRANSIRLLVFGFDVLIF